MPIPFPMFGQPYRRLKEAWGIVKLTTERKNTFDSAGISSGSEVLTSHVGL
jgi:hypothetical protein